MFSQGRDAEQHTEDNARAIDDLVDRNGELDEQAAALLESLEVRPEQIHALLEDPSQFTPGNWEQIQTQLRLRDEKIEREIANVPDPSKASAARAGQNAQQHWMFVK